MHFSILEPARESGVIRTTAGATTTEMLTSVSEISCVTQSSLYDGNLGTFFTTKIGVPPSFKNPNSLERGNTPLIFFLDEE